MLGFGAEPTVDGPLKMAFQLVRLFDGHGHIAREIDVGRASASFCDVRRYGIGRARDLIRKSAPLSRKEPGNRGGFEGKHVGFLPDLKELEDRGYRAARLACGGHQISTAAVKVLSGTSP